MKFSIFILKKKNVNIFVKNIKIIIIDIKIRLNSINQKFKKLYLL